MTTFYATIRHHSISRARIIKIDGTLTQAKRVATREFGGDYNDNILTIFGAAPNGEMDRDYIVATRRLESKRWHNAD